MYSEVTEFRLVFEVSLYLPDSLSLKLVVSFFENNDVCQREKEKEKKASLWQVTVFLTAL